LFFFFLWLPSIWPKQINYVASHENFADSLRVWFYACNYLLLWFPRNILGRNLCHLSCVWWV
jgi:hypothetical protein